MSATANLIDARRYGRLLAKALPVRIRTEEENERMLAEIEHLMDKGEGNLSPEEDTLFDLMVFLVEDFESRAYPIPDAPPQDILRFLMEQRDLKQADLVPILGSKGHVSDIVNGKRGISKEHAKALAAFFHVSPEVFI
jgi:HTH-type transcriptional regulator/antitoxin HigA